MSFGGIKTLLIFGPFDEKFLDPRTNREKLIISLFSALSKVCFAYSRAGLGHSNTPEIYVKENFPLLLTYV